MAAMFSRVTDLEGFKDALSLSPCGEDPTDDEMRFFMANDKNLVYTDGDNYSVFTYNTPKIYTGHWFFRVRGRAALDVADKMLRQFWSETEADYLRGITRVDLQGARWAARKIGMKSQGVIPDLEDGHNYEYFLMTRQEFMERNADGLTVR